MQLVITMSLVATLTFLAVPSYNQSIANSRMDSNNNSLANAIGLARVEAIKRGTHVAVKPTNILWKNGISVWVDDDRDGVIDSTEVVLKKFQPFQGTATVTTSSNSVIFKSSGFADAAASFLICDDRSGETGRSLTILISGRIRSIEDNTCT